MKKVSSRWESQDLTHDELVRQSAYWLKNNRRCQIVASQLMAGNAMETPDVIGWNGRASTIIEAKKSIADFRADSRKPFRSFAETGMGIFRYYLVPFELRDSILPILPEKWGLILCKARDVSGYRWIWERKSRMFENNKTAEILFLSSIIRRIAGNANPLKGVSVKCYTIDIPNPRAELFIEPEATS